VRAESITLRLADTLLVIGADTEDTAVTLRARYADALVDPIDTQPVIDVVLAERSGAKRSGGLRPVPQLKLGSYTIARSRRADDVLDALDTWLHSYRASRLAHLAEAGTALPHVGLRLFIGPQGAALIALAYPQLVGDRQLAAAGVVEQVAAGIAVDPAGPMVQLPGSLTSPANTVVTAPLVLVAGLAEDPAEGRTAPVGPIVATLASLHDDVRWFTALRHLADRGAAHAATDSTEVRGVLLAALG
jgi:hypothetical protein